MKRGVLLGGIVAFALALQAPYTPRAGVAAAAPPPFVGRVGNRVGRHAIGRIKQRFAVKGRDRTGAKDDRHVRDKKVRMARREVHWMHVKARRAA